MTKYLDKISSLAAAVVTIGAWAKIAHKSYADTALTIGLFSEAIIFILYFFFYKENTSSAQQPSSEVDKKVDKIINTLRSI